MENFMQKLSIIQFEGTQDVLQTEAKSVEENKQGHPTRI